MSINLFDIIFVVIILAFTLLSYLRGLVRELFALVGLGAGFLAATHYSRALAEQLNPLLQDRSAAELLAFVLLMVAGYLVGVFLAGFSDMFRRSPESGLSQLAGGVVGFAKGVTISLALYWVVMTHLPMFQNELAGSAIGSWLGTLLRYLEQTKLI
ncbi:MAG TPA: CvpA family protein [bacterium]|nr:CvpA family protein [bacterium]